MPTFGALSRTPERSIDRSLDEGVTWVLLYGQPNRYQPVLANSFLSLSLFLSQLNWNSLCSISSTHGGAA